MGVVTINLTHRKQRQEIHLIHLCMSVTVVRNICFHNVSSLTDTYFWLKSIVSKSAYFFCSDYERRQVASSGIIYLYIIYMYMCMILHVQNICIVGMWSHSCIILGWFKVSEWIFRGTKGQSLQRYLNTCFSLFKHICVYVCL